MRIEIKPMRQPMRPCRVGGRQCNALNSYKSKRGDCEKAEALSEANCSKLKTHMPITCVRAIMRAARAMVSSGQLNAQTRRLKRRSLTEKVRQAGCLWCHSAPTERVGGVMRQALEKARCGTTVKIGTRSWPAWCSTKRRSIGQTFDV
jgi:hypothetical protein